MEPLSQLCMKLTSKIALLDGFSVANCNNDLLKFTYSSDRIFIQQVPATIMSLPHTCIPYKWSSWMYSHGPSYRYVKFMYARQCHRNDDIIYHFGVSCRWFDSFLRIKYPLRTCPFDIFNPEEVNVSATADILHRTSTRFPEFTRTADL